MGAQSAQSQNDRPKILFVDDELAIREFAAKVLPRRNMDVVVCESGEKAIEILKSQQFDVLITDINMSNIDGLELLAHTRKHYPSTGVMLITGVASIQNAVRAMSGGAVDYIDKSCFTADYFIERIQKYLDNRSDESVAQPKTAQRRKRRKSEHVLPKIDFIGESKTITRLLSVVKNIINNVNNHASILIQGESGTGKEVLAKLIHQESVRSKGPFHSLNCANIPEKLVESQLFGHVKGAFTDAKEDKVGAFEVANGGTLLLDEITEIRPEIQVKLLRVLQEGEFQRLGSQDIIKVDVRVIATSNRNFKEAMATGIFRTDLYHRLAIFPLVIPALRERLSDIPLLAQHFCDDFCEMYGLEAKTFSSELIASFKLHDWPGNVRQLQNYVHRGVVLSTDENVIEYDHVMNNYFSDVSDEEGGAGNLESVKLMAGTLEEMERHMILESLKDNNNNQQLAAEQLGISARTIRNKLKRYRMDGWI